MGGACTKDECLGRESNTGDVNAQADDDLVTLNDAMLSDLGKVSGEMKRDTLGFRYTEDSEDHRQRMDAMVALHEDKKVSASGFEYLPAMSEIEAVRELRDCQVAAVTYIRCKAWAAHQQTLPLLRERVKSLGFDAGQLKQTLGFIRDKAPIIIHVDIGKTLKFLRKDSHYRNQFETATSGGKLSAKKRIEWERSLFGDAYDHGEGAWRPKYGVLNSLNDRGSSKCVPTNTELRRGRWDCGVLAIWAVILCAARRTPALHPHPGGLRQHVQGGEAPPLSVHSWQLRVGVLQVACVDYYAHVLHKALGTPSQTYSMLTPG